MLPRFLFCFQGREYLECQVPPFVYYFVFLLGVLHFIYISLNHHTSPFTSFISLSLSFSLISPTLYVKINPSNPLEVTFSLYCSLGTPVYFFSQGPSSLSVVFSCSRNSTLTHRLTSLWLSLRSHEFRATHHLSSLDFYESHSTLKEPVSVLQRKTRSTLPSVMTEHSTPITRNLT